MSLFQARYSELSANVRTLAKGRPVVFANGCFDIIHVGHINLFEFASNIILDDTTREDKHKNPNFLVVALNDDASVRRLKGLTRPVFSLLDRMRVVSVIKSVSLVCSFSEDTPLKLIQALMPDAIVKGGDYRGTNVVGSDFAPVYFAPLIRGVSTTETLRRFG